MKSVNAAMSASGMNESRPSRSVNPSWNLVNAARSSNVPLSGWTLGASLPPVRSPRQCIGPWLAIPRRLWVVVGPFIGWKMGLVMGVGGKVKKFTGGEVNGPGMGVTLASGLPRSQARLSKSPETWQLEQDESPWAELNEAS